MRRRVLQALGAGGLAAAVARPSLAAQPQADAVRYVACRQRDGAQEAAVIDLQGRDQAVVPLPERGHSFAIDPPTRRIVAFGRQPGFYALAFDEHGRQLAELPLPEDRHYFGHGVFVDGGRRLLATENDFDGARGVLGVYDASAGGGYRRLGELDGGGVGPHEVVALPGTRIVVVANGGIQTHPDYGKMALNLAAMRPSLVYLDWSNGDILERVELGDALRQLSIRHLAVDGDGRVWFGCQYVGPAGDRPALVGSHRRGQAQARLHEGSAEVLRGLDNYVGSMAVDWSGTIVATSSPVGGAVAYWEAASGRLLGTTALGDGCGVAPGRGAGDFLLSSGEGELRRVHAAQPGRTLLRVEGLAWDNHMRRLDKV
ncbi:DUF1513 domain-containing protein [Verticiella sediminum]|uniref:DUF1513 domain-containing protein n=2 Tax=Verticiella sediminum TaxID=1247510 RepID=A0A556ACZ6_9BURK|nr:DUF1513 domain-containing protein [Verticiella sediminum]